MKKRVIFVCAIIVLILVAVIVWYMTQVYGTGSITFVQESGVILEYGEDYASEQLIEQMDGELKETVVIDTKVLGQQELVFTVVKDGKEKAYPYTVEIRDTKAPDIQITATEVSIALGDVFIPAAYVVSVQDPYYGALKQNDQPNVKGTYWFVYDVDPDTAGNYTLSIYALDQVGNETKAEITVRVTADPIHSPPTHSSYTGGYDGDSDPYHCEPYYVNGILLVNKLHPLPFDYGGLDPTAAEALGRLQAAARLEGYDIPTLSGYRSYDYQGTLYHNYVARDGQVAADTYSARPGYSEHQSGLAFDVGAIDNHYGDTQEGMWLYAHCHEYGFIVRYLAGKENITGYQYEPWHIRYVGVEAASEIQQRGITLEEYLGVR